MKRILVVDDSLIMRMNLKKIFEKQGYQIIAEAANGQEAVEKYEKFRPDLVTMDITMPVLDGIGALCAIRAMDDTACVVMISALGQEAKIIEAMNSGARHYITKPFKEQDVLCTIADIFGGGVTAEARAYA
jgi:two-component system chemotaxis response regulator CheY